MSTFEDNPVLDHAVSVGLASVYEWKVPARAQGLATSVGYHYRFIASNFIRVIWHLRRGQYIDRNMFLSVQLLLSCDLVCGPVGRPAGRRAGGRADAPSLPIPSDPIPSRPGRLVCERAGGRAVGRSVGRSGGWVGGRAGRRAGRQLSGRGSAGRPGGRAGRRRIRLDKGQAVET